MRKNLKITKRNLKDVRVVFLTKDTLICLFLIFVHQVPYLRLVRNVEKWSRARKSKKKKKINNINKINLLFNMSLHCYRRNEIKNELYNQMRYYS